MSPAHRLIGQEFALLAACLRPPIDPLAPDAIRTAGAAPLDWPLLVRLAARHRVVPGLAAGLARAALAPPAPVAALLATAQIRAAHEELSLAAIARRLLARLAQGGIDAAVLKGPPLSMALHGRLGVRTSRDLDLLVAPAAARAAVETMIEAGLRPVEPARLAGFADGLRRHKDIELIDPASGIVVELHWRLFDNPHLLPPPAAREWVRARLDRDSECWVLPERANLLFLCNHGAQHGWSRLKWLADVAGLLAVRDEAERRLLYAGIARREGRLAVAQTMLLCDALFGLGAPAAVRRRARIDPRLGLLVGLALRCMAGGGAAELEQRRLGSAAKNASHYLVSFSPTYLLAEAWFDLTDVSTLAPASRWRRLGPIGRIGGWLERLVRHR